MSAIDTEYMDGEGRFVPVGSVLAEEITEGMFLTGVGNGYVVEVVADGYGRKITFHTADGDEGTLTVPGNVTVMVSMDGKARA